jgi:polar amino acid transport system substrate-binding protein
MLSMFSTRRSILFRSFLFLAAVSVIASACGSGAATTPPATTPPATTPPATATNGAPATVGGPTAAATCPYADVIQGDTLTVGMISDPPFSFRDADGTWTSLAPELDRKFGKFLCKNIEFVAGTWATTVAALQARKYMVFGTDLHKTDERAKAIAFSTPFNFSGTSYWVDPSATPDLKTIDDINKPNVTIVCITGSDGQAATEKYLKNAKETLLPNATVQDVMLQLQTHRAMVLCTSSYEDNAFKQLFPQWRIITDSSGKPAVLDPLGAGWAFNLADTALLAAANAFMDEEVKSGDLDAMTKQYITVDNSVHPAS